MKKRFLGVLLSVAMVAAVLAGCGSSGAKETAAPAAKQKLQAKQHLVKQKQHLVKQKQQVTQVT